MQPLTPLERAALNARGITDAEIDEYQTLLANRFASGGTLDATQAARLRELAQRIMTP